MFITLLLPLLPVVVPLLVLVLATFCSNKTTLIMFGHLDQRCPTFLAPGTGFMEDSFSTDGGGGMVRAVMRAMGKMKLRWFAHHSPPAVRPSSSQGVSGLSQGSPGVGDPWLRPLNTGSIIVEKRYFLQSSLYIIIESIRKQLSK